MIRKLLMRVAWYVNKFGDWLYFLGLGHSDYSSPSYCKHCGKWNIEQLEEEKQNGNND